MFRARRERTLFGQIPLRHILLIVVVLALAVATVLIWSLEREKEAIERIIAGRPGIAHEAFQLPLGRVRGDVLKITAILFLLAVAGIAAVITYQNYYSLNQVFERTKTLARNILESIASGVITLDRKGRVTSINAAAERILGLDPRQVVWRPYTETFRFQPEILEVARTAGEEQAHASEVELECAAGKDGRPAFIRLSTSELKAPDGQTVGVVLLIRDCSEVVHLERQLRHADKMAALGTLSAGLAHEIKNPLSALELNLHLLRGELKDQEESLGDARSYLEILGAELKRLNGILETFMRFSRPTELHLAPLKINETLEHVLSLVTHEAREKTVEVHASLAEDLPLVVGDDGQLTQVFLNLVINALQAMPDGGRLEVASGLSDAAPGFVSVRVTDTGVGIPAAHVAKLFEPYFTTREGGLGLGLAIAYRIVKDHGGRIDVRSGLGAGTTMTVLLPIRRQDAYLWG